MTTPTQRTIEIGAWITLGTILLYAAGWSYAYHWFDYFNLGVIHLGIPTEYYLMYGFRVVHDYWWFFLMIFVSASFTWFFRPGPMPWLRWWSLPLSVLAFMLVYAFGEKSADHDFDRHNDKGFDRYPLTRVWLTPGTKTDPALANLAEDLAAGRYRLLVQSETSLFLIKPVPKPQDKANMTAGEPPQSSPQIPTVQVSLRQIKATRHIPVNPGIGHQTEKTNF
uniref:Uncharacterized protein n=1 Tax=Candidatus Kentrum sp. FW TaxID=2126338 RepID=A0A450STB7_9GAMM|nr:MAG: hypothetical protein BECKFW1821A_GA0114235_106917 [Candidatus Kentron sp. FW]